MITHNSDYRVCGNIQTKRYSYSWTLQVIPFTWRSYASARTQGIVTVKPKCRRLYRWWTRGFFKRHSRLKNIDLYGKKFWMRLKNAQKWYWKWQWHWNLISNNGRCFFHKLSSYNKRPHEVLRYMNYLRSKHGHVHAKGAKLYPLVCGKRRRAHDNYRYSN